ncbi:MAG TPA: efflux RND transporter permease subunit, partial [Candidatus Cloacimonadota bacterium]|nr:efflux RND transporter permease subunit [Candidatus Cloacimonadota bacterium]
MKLPEIAVKNPVFTLMFFLAILIFGIVSLTMLPRDILPDAEIPAITIVTVYPGASASEVEEQVTKLLENQLSSVTNLTKISSKSKENVSFISLEFDWNTNLDEASNDTRDMLELVKQDLPSSAYSPSIVKVNSSMVPVLIYNVTAKESYNTLDQILNEKMTDRLKRVKGVGNFIIVGQKERQVKVEIDPYRLQAYQLNMGTIAQAIKAENLTVPGGSIDLGLNELSVRVPGDFETIQDIENLVLASVNGKIVRLADVAKVSDDYKEKDEITKGFKERSVVIMVQKQSGANTLEVASAVKKEIALIQKTMPADVKINQAIDSSVMISHSIKNVTSTIWYAAFFVIFVVIFFMGNVRNSLIIILTIPFSLVLAFIY